MHENKSISHSPTQQRPICESGGVACCAITVVPRCASSVAATTSTGSISQSEPTCGGVLSHGGSTRRRQRRGDVACICLIVSCITYNRYAVFSPTDTFEDRTTPEGCDNTGLLTSAIETYGVTHKFYRNLRGGNNNDMGFAPRESTGHP